MNPRRRTAIAATLAATLPPAIPAAHAQLGRAGAHPPLAASDDEKRVLEVLQDVHRRQRYLSVPESDGRLLRLLVSAMNAQHVVEVGTSTGYSGLWLLLGLRGTGGRLTTFEIDPGRHAQARANFDRAGLGERADARLGDAHRGVTRLEGPIDLVFLDADKEGYLAYFRALVPKLRPGGLIVAHNMASPRPDPRYVAAITTDAAFETSFVHMDEAGMALTLKKR